MDVDSEVMLLFLRNRFKHDLSGIKRQKRKKQKVSVWSGFFEKQIKSVHSMAMNSSQLSFEQNFFSRCIICVKSREISKVMILNQLLFIFPTSGSTNCGKIDENATNSLPQTHNSFLTQNQTDSNMQYLTWFWWQTKCDRKWSMCV